MPPFRVVFEIEADACAQLLNRLTGLFAQQDRLPDLVRARSNGTTLRVRIVIGDLEPLHAAILGNKMRAIVTVRHVRLGRLPAGRRGSGQS